MTFHDEIDWLGGLSALRAVTYIVMIIDGMAFFLEFQGPLLLVAQVFGVSGLDVFLLCLLSARRTNDFAMAFQSGKRVGLEEAWPGTGNCFTLLPSAGPEIKGHLVSWNIRPR